ncbi:unnamed protein product [Ciceribacter sp. T2.26MG-112.2]|nr:unnamed protein product [Ciceribacter naphthalenivorans]
MRDGGEGRIVGGITSHGRDLGWRCRHAHRPIVQGDWTGFGGGASEKLLNAGQKNATCARPTPLSEWTE